MELLKFSWLQRLPEGTQAILASTDGSLEVFAVTTAKIHKVHSHQIVAKYPASSAEMWQQMTALMVNVVALMFAKAD